VSTRAARCAHQRQTSANRRRSRVETLSREGRGVRAGVYARRRGKKWLLGCWCPCVFLEGRLLAVCGVPCELPPSPITVVDCCSGLRGGTGAWLYVDRTPYQGMQTNPIRYPTALKDDVKIPWTILTPEFNAEYTQNLRTRLKRARTGIPGAGLIQDFIRRRGRAGKPKSFYISFAESRK
jgi:hypothetical protein